MMACAVCGCAATDFYCVKDGYTVRRCRGCGGGFLELGAGANPAELYRVGYHQKGSGETSLKGYDDYYALGPALRRTFADRLRELVELNGGAREALLDVGCGPGFFLDLASSHYASVAGVELGREAAAYARDVHGLQVHEQEFSAGLFKPRSFDAVTFFDTIEHLADPAQALRDAHALLKPGGVLMLTTGDFASLPARLSGRYWHIITPPDHLFFFTPRGLEGLLERTGFEVLWRRYPQGHFTADYLLERIVKSLRLGMGYRGMESLRARLKKVFVPMNLWDIMLVTARRIDTEREGKRRKETA